VLAGVAAALIFGWLGYQNARLAIEEEARQEQAARAMAAYKASHRGLLAAQQLNASLRNARAEALTRAARAAQEAQEAHVEREAAEKALTAAKAGGSPEAALVAAEHVIAALKGELAGAEAGRVAEREAGDASEARAVLWEKAAQVAQAAADSLAVSLARYQRAADCHWLGLRFLPRCLSRTASATAGAAGAAALLLLVGR